MATQLPAPYFPPPSRQLAVTELPQLPAPTPLHPPAVSNRAPSSTCTILVASTSWQWSSSPSCQLARALLHNCNDNCESPPHGKRPARILLYCLWAAALSHTPSKAVGSAHCNPYNVPTSLRTDQKKPFKRPQLNVTLLHNPCRQCCCDRLN